MLNVSCYINQKINLCTIRKKPSSFVFYCAAHLVSTVKYSDGEILSRTDKECDVIIFSQYDNDILRAGKNGVY